MMMNIIIQLWLGMEEKLLNIIIQYIHISFKFLLTQNAQFIMLIGLGLLLFGRAKAKPAVESHIENADNDASDARLLLYQKIGHT